jgi:hypothetical protein
MNQVICCFILVLLSMRAVIGDDAILVEAINNAKKQEQFRLTDGKHVRYSTTENRNGNVIQRVDGYMVHQDGQSLHRRVEDRMQLSTSSIAVNLSSAKFRADLRCDLRPQKSLPKAVDDMAGQQFVIVDYATDRAFHPGGIIHFAPAVASTIPKYSLVSNFVKWRDSGNKAQYTAPDSTKSSDAKFHKFVLTNWPQEHVPELTLWVDDKMRIVKTASKEEKFGFSDVCTILETVNVEGVEFPVHFVSERTRVGSDPKSFKTEVKATISEVESPVPTAWFTLEHYGVTPREQPKFAAPPSNKWKLFLGASVLLAGIVAVAFYLRRRQT